MENVYLTKDGLKALKKELDELVEQKRPKLIKRVAQARGMGDLSENSEYANAREELALIDGRIEELEGILYKAKIIKEKFSQKGKEKEVKLGSKVTVKVGRKTHVYVLVGEWEADPLNKKISHSSPLGKSLLGKKKGEWVEIEAPIGKIIYEILGID